MGQFTVDLKETSSSDCDDSFVAPTRFRVQAVALAVVAGTCWGFGPLGKKAPRWMVDGEDRRRRNIVGNKC